MIWFSFVDGRSAEDEAELRKELFSGRNIDPFQQMKVVFQNQAKAAATPAKKKEAPAQPMESKTLATKTDYVPPWWKGERAAYANAKKAMTGIGSLPKMKA